MVQGFLDNPLLLASPEGVARSFGGAVFAEVVASFLMAHAADEHMNLLEQLSSNDAISDHLATVVRTAIDKGHDGAVSFLRQAIMVFGEDELPELFDKPESTPALLAERLEAMNDADARSAFPIESAEAASELLDDGEDDALAQRFLRSKDRADEDEFGETATGAYDLNEGYVVFGFFRSTSIKDVLKDSWPLCIVTWYSIWDVVTRQLLKLVMTKSILVSNEDGSAVSVQHQWLSDMRFEVFTGDHSYIGIIGIIGLTIWSVGGLVGIFVKLYRNKFRLQEPSLLRQFAYFYNGYEPKVYWWEILVKKGDVLSLYLISFTEVLPDPRAKLPPFDDRKNRLADRLEMAALGVRFGTLLGVQILLMVDAPAGIAALVAGIMIVMNAWFLASTVFLLAIEIQDLLDSTGDEEKLSKANSARRTRQRTRPWSGSALETTPSRKHCPRR